MKLENYVLIDVHDKVQEFNQYFLSVFTVDHDIMFEHDLSNVTHFLDRVDFNEAVVLKHLKMLSNKHSSGVDNIPQSFLKRFSVFLV